MYQLHRARASAYSGKREKKLKASQALRHKLSAYSNAHKHIIFMFIRVDSKPLQLLLRLVLIPVIAGVSYEFIRLAGRYDNPVVNMLSVPGLLMQRMTTKEPDDEMIEVGIASVEAVFDWKKWQEENNVCAH